MDKKTDLRPESVRELLLRHKALELKDHKDHENQRMMELHQMWTELHSLQDKEARIQANITKNLKTISAQKHALQKFIQTSNSETPKLPVTHKHHQEILNLVSDAINFVNKFPEVEKSVKPENDVDTDKLCQEINTCGESVNHELSRSKTRVDQVEALKENAELIKNCVELLSRDGDGEDEDDQDLMG